MTQQHVDGGSRDDRLGVVLDSRGHNEPRAPSAPEKVRDDSPSSDDCSDELDDEDAALAAVVSAVSVQHKDASAAPVPGMSTQLFPTLWWRRTRSSKCCVKAA